MKMRHAFFAEVFHMVKTEKPARRKYGGGKQRKKEKGQDRKTEVMSPPKGK